MSKDQIKDKEAQTRKLDKRAEALRANLKRRKEQTASTQKKVDDTL